MSAPANYTITRLAKELTSLAEDVDTLEETVEGIESGSGGTSLGWINVTDEQWGGVWDGEGDDTAAWQAAYAEAASQPNGGVLFAPWGTRSRCLPSTFQIPIPWNASDNPVWIFAPETEVKLSAKAAAFIQPVTSADEGTEIFSGLHVEGITINANNIVNNSANNFTYGVLMAWGKYQSVDDVSFTACKTYNLGGLTANSSRRSIDFTFISSDIFEDSVPITCTNVTIKNCEFSGGNYGVQMQGYTATDHSTRLKRFEPWVMNLYFDNIVIDGVHWDSGTPPTTTTAADGGTGIMVGGMGYGGRIRISNCVMRNSIDDGLELGPFTDALIDNCVIENCWFENVLIRTLGACPDPEKLSYTLRNCKIGFTEPIPNVVSGYAHKGLLYDPPGSITMEGCEFYGCETAVDLRGSFHTATIKNLAVDFNMDRPAPADGYGQYQVALNLDCRQSGVIEVDGLHIRNDMTLSANGHTNLQLYYRHIFFKGLSNHDVTINNVTVNNRKMDLPANPSTRGYSVFYFDPSTTWNGQETFGAASNLEDRHFYDAGDVSSITVSGGVGTSATLGTEVRAISLNLASEEVYPTVDNCAWIKCTPNATITDQKTGIVNKRIAADTYIEGYVTDDGTNSLLCLDKVVAGTRTSLLGSITNGGAGTVTAVSTPTSYQSDRGVALASRISNGTAYYVRCKTIDGVVTAEYFTSTPGIPTAAGAATTGAITLSSNDNIMFADPIEGYPGWSFVGVHASDSIDNFTVNRVGKFQLSVNDVVLSVENKLAGSAIGMINFANTDYAAYIRTTGIRFRNLKMAANDFASASSAAIIRNLTNLGTWRNYFSVNGADYVPASSSISAPGTGTAYQNLDGIPQMVKWAGGTLTTPFVEYSADGTNYMQVWPSATDGSYLLPPAHYVRWTYSSAPTFTRLPLAGA